MFSEGNKSQAGVGNDVEQQPAISIVATGIVSAELLGIEGACHGKKGQESGPRRCTARAKVLW